MKVLKGLAEYHDITLGDLLEGIVLHAFEGKVPFGKESLKLVADLKKIYKVELDAAASHRLAEGSLVFMAQFPSMKPSHHAVRNFPPLPEPGSEEDGGTVMNLIEQNRPNLRLRNGSRTPESSAGSLPTHKSTGWGKPS